MDITTVLTVSQRTGTDMTDFYTAPQAGDFFTASDPFALFADWLQAAEAHEPNDPNAMALATVDKDGMPNIRVVLLKQMDASGLVFYTNIESAKGVELAQTPKAAANFHWKSLRRQIRVRGVIEPVSPAEADAYFASRPKGSQIGAWASQQSRELADRKTLEQRIAELERQFAGKAVPRPPYWSGFRLIPQEIEFWHDRPFRLHDRLQFLRATPDAPWTKRRLYP